MKKYVLLVFLTLFLFTACSEESVTTYPARQAELIAITNDARVAFNDGTSAQKDGAVENWKKALLDYGSQGLQFSNWLAEVKDVQLEGKTGIGKALSDHSIAVVTVTFEKITLESASLILANSPEEMLLEGEALYDTAIALNKGEQVLVSGYFIKDIKGGPREISVTNSGAIDRPEYLVKFTEIKKQK